MSGSHPGTDANLLEFLKRRSGTDPVLGTDRGWLSVEEVQQNSLRLRNVEFEHLQGRAVSLACNDVEEFVTCVVALDGWASSILLYEKQMDAELLQKFERNAGTSTRVEPGPTPLEVGGHEYKDDSRGPTRWLISTSGTTGEPKLVSHTLAGLSRTVKPAPAAAVPLIWGLLYEPTRFAGLQVLLQAIAGGGSVIVPADYRDLGKAIDTLARLGCNAISATPSLWRKLVVSQLLEKLSLQTLTLGGETADQRILDLLANRFPQSTIRHIYASTEAGVGFSVADRIAGFPAAFLERPPAGVQLRVREDGMLFLKPSLAEQKFIGCKEELQDAGGWIETGDLVVKRGGRFHFLGRANGCINVGGQKVHPSEVEEVVLGVPGVLAARAFGRSNPILGSLVAADIVAEPGIDKGQLREAILGACRSSLSRYHVPAILQFVDQLQLNATGKLQR